MPAKKAAKKPLKKATKKGKKRTTRKTEDVQDYRYSYVYLRTMLDALEMGSLHYFLDGKTSSERNSRAAKLMTLIKPVLTEIEKWDVEPVNPDCPGDTECPPGYTNCNGCCVPYPCPGDVPPEDC